MFSAEEPPRSLTFLDPEFFAGTSNPGTPGTPEVETEFICAVCLGVVLEPQECKECSSLFCKGCISAQNMPCPKRCGGQEFTKVNRLIMNALNKLPFRCQYSPKCEKVVTYDQYAVHFKECPEGRPK